MILDTTVIIDLIRRDRAAIARVKALEGQGEALLIPIPAIYELYDGVERGDWPEQEARQISQVLRAYPTCELSSDAAERAGRIAGALGRKGFASQPVDALIAGIALESGQPVLTRNTRDFQRFPDLETIGY